MKPHSKLELASRDNALTPVLDAAVRHILAQLHRQAGTSADLPYGNFNPDSKMSCILDRHALVVGQQRRKTLRNGQ